MFWPWRPSKSLSNKFKSVSDKSISNKFLSEKSKGNPRQILDALIRTNEALYLRWNEHRFRAYFGTLMTQL